MLTKKTITHISFALIIVNLAVALKFAIVGVGVNLLLISFSALIISLNFKLLFNFYKSEFVLYLYPIFLLIPYIINPNTFRYISFFYGLMFLFLFQVFICFLYSGQCSINLYRKVLTLIIKLYFYVALIQFLIFPFGLLFNQIWVEGSLILNRVNSLATEPSYAGIIITITFYSLLVLQSHESKKKYSLTDVRKDFKLWAFVIFVVISSQSGYAIVFFIVLLFTLVSFRNLIFPILSISVIVIASLYFKLDSFERVSKMLPSIFTLDIPTMVAADHSGSIRIAPLIILFSQSNPLDLSFWIGHGIGYSKELMVSLIPGINYYEWKGGAFLHTHIFDYGFISMLFLFFFFKKNAITKLIGFDTIFLLLIFLNSSFNTQLFWFAIIIFTSNKYYLSRLNFLSKKKSIEKRDYLLPST